MFDPFDLCCFLLCQGEEGDQGSPGEVGSQGPTVRLFRLLRVTASFSLYGLVSLLTEAPACSVVTSGPSGTPWSHGNDGLQRRDGKSRVYDF